MTKLSRDFHIHAHAVIPIQAFRRNLKKLKPLFKGYLVPIKSYDPLKEAKENVNTLNQKSK